MMPNTSDSFGELPYHKMIGCFNKAEKPDKKPWPSKDSRLEITLASSNVAENFLKVLVSYSVVLLFFNVMRKIQSGGRVNI